MVCIINIVLDLIRKLLVIILTELSIIYLFLVIAIDL